MRSLALILDELCNMRGGRRRTRFTELNYNKSISFRVLKAGCYIPDAVFCQTNSSSYQGPEVVL
jgi:hypothetical protein